MAQRNIFEIAEVEKLVLDDRPADSCAQAVLVESRFVRDALPHERLIERIQISILQVVVNAAVDLVAAALNNRIELAPGRVTEFRLELVQQERPFAHCLV